MHALSHAPSHSRKWSVWMCATYHYERAFTIVTVEEIEVETAPADTQSL